VAEPDWKAAVKTDLEHFAYVVDEQGELMRIVSEHIEAAYRRGLIAGRSQAGYGTRRKRKEAD